MESEYLIQVVHKKSGRIAQWAPGLKVEKDLEAELLNRIKEKGVGVFRTESRVLAAIQTALRELLFDLKSKV